MNISIKKLTEIISKNYADKICLKKQKNLLKRANIRDELIQLSINNIKYHNKNQKIFYNKQSYNKLLIEENDYLKFYLITWGENALSKLHTHNDKCLFKVINCEIEETTLSPNNNFIKTKKICYSDDVNFVENGDFHQMRNLSDTYGISFHIYNK